MLNFRELRESRNLATYDIEKALGLKSGAVYKWENGKSSPKLKHYEQLADILKVEIIDIFNLFNKRSN